jgi:hypothetical protein
MSYGNKEHVVIQVDQGLKAEVETLTTSLAQSASKINDLVHYNITDYAGNSLNEKWDNMRANFVSFQPKEILIPIPKANQQGAVLSNGWKWKLTAPMIFDDKCNCAKVLIYDEIVSDTNIDSAVRFDDALKPEDIDFPLGLRIRGDSLNNKKIGIGLDIRSSARLNFFGQVLINDCDYPVVIGGDNQSAPAEVSFDKLSIGFPKECGIILHGKTTDVTLKANEISIQILQQSGKDAMKIMGKAIAVDIKHITYNTDVAKNGYVAFDAQNVVHILPSDAQSLRNVKIGEMFANNAVCGLKIDNPNAQSTKPRNIFVDNIRINPGDSYAYDIDFCDNVVIENIGEFNLGKVGSTAVFPRLNRKASTKAITDNSQKNVINNLATRTNLGVFDLPSPADFPLGTVIANQTVNGNRVYLKHKETGVVADDLVQIDSQMFIPNVTSLPAASWNLRGKMYMIWNSTAVDDGIYICARRSTGAYGWRELISGTWV